MKYIQLMFPVMNKERREIAIALLSEAGAHGFEETKSGFSAYFNESELDRGRLDEALVIIEEEPLEKEIEKENWNAQWESSFEPVIIPGIEDDSEYAVIRAPFHALNVKCSHDVIITPRMSFGTGHHATTYLMVHEMSGISLFNKKVFDYGSGTGILAIIAAREGAEVTAVDYDDNCIENAGENFIVNKVEVKLFKAESVSGDSEYDVILANINRNVIIKNIDNIYKSLKHGGTVLFSGMLSTDEDTVLPFFISAGLTLKRTVHKDNWVMIHMIK